VAGRSLQWSEGGILGGGGREGLWLPLLPPLFFLPVGGCAKRWTGRGRRRRSVGGAVGGEGQYICKGWCYRNLCAVVKDYVWGGQAGGKGGCFHPPPLKLSARQPASHHTMNRNRNCTPSHHSSHVTHFFFNKSTPQRRLGSSCVCGSNFLDVSLTRERGKKSSSSSKNPKMQRQTQIHRCMHICARPFFGARR
jgi:hypothetical protein